MCEFLSLNPQIHRETLQNIAVEYRYSLQYINKIYVNLILPFLDLLVSEPI